VKHRYAVGRGTFVVLTPDVERALCAVRRAQGGTAAVRRDFLRNVSGYLRGALETDGGTEVELDRVFSDEGLSERVKGSGVWEEKALPWIKQGFRTLAATRTTGTPVRLPDRADIAQ
jgi:hypothetical protein